MLLDELPIAGHHAAEVLCPRLIQGAVDDDTGNVSCPKGLWFGREPEERVDRALLQSPHRLDGRQGDPGDVPTWIETHVCRHAGKEDVGRSTQLRDGHGLALEVTDGSDLVRAEQLETADVAPCEDHDRITRRDSHDIRCGEVHRDVDLAGCQGRLNLFGALLGDVLDVGEPFTPQEVFGHVLRCDADTRPVIELEGPGFRRGLAHGRRDRQAPSGTRGHRAQSCHREAEAGHVS